MPSNKILSYLARRPAINASALEREADIPAGTINQVKLGNQSFTFMQKHKLEKVLKKYGMK